VTGVTSLKDRICNYILEREHVSFIELEREFPEIRGDANKGRQNLAWEHDNLILWTGLSDEAIDVMRALIGEGRIHMWVAGKFTYLLDGGGLDLPKATRFQAYEKPYWLPVTFHKRPPTDAEMMEIAQSFDIG